ncbi:hypothetical protein DE146DRAFT_635334 [Phaeosphaeria sp. MPI-PUGE-AT-0046c]|nr:hypothetical protein DE146DRAFT_635334 [Phaeosphaeria sp. MPI-PUGE-AT-0046c]
MDLRREKEDNEEEEEEEGVEGEEGDDAEMVGGPRVGNQGPQQAPLHSSLIPPTIFKPNSPRPLFTAKFPPFPASCQYTAAAGSSRSLAASSLRRRSKSAKVDDSAAAGTPWYPRIMLNSGGRGARWRRERAGRRVVVLVVLLHMCEGEARQGARQGVVGSLPQAGAETEREWYIVVCDGVVRDMWYDEGVMWEEFGHGSVRLAWGRMREANKSNNGNSRDNQVLPGELKQLELGHGR